MTGLNTIRRAFIKSALVLAAGAATLGLPSVSAEEYAEIMDNLNLENPDMIDVAVPANIRGLTLDNVN